MGLRISRSARERLGLEASSLGPDGNVVVPTAHAARLLAWDINQATGTDAVSAGLLTAVSQLDEAYRTVITAYLGHDREALARAASALEARFGADLDRVLELFASEYLEWREAGAGAPAATPDRPPARRPERSQLLYELLVFWLIDTNPAGAEIVRPLHTGALTADPAYRRVGDALAEILAAEPVPEGQSEDLVTRLTRPSKLAPDSLADQLRYVLEEWRELLGGEGARVLATLDIIAEESKPRLPPGPGPVETPSFSGLEDEGENYSPDLDWMPRLILIAKNVHVWLDQLGRSHGAAVTRLDQIPDEELARLAGWGFTGLWLIGLWERSPGSRRIKQAMGSANAAASAYSIFDYRIAADLGGEDALSALAERAWRHGIRLAADMVPNHMGIDSRWVIEHPDWFVSTDRSPFPVYSFEGPDLSEDPAVGIYLEDHYYDRSDAAVVFKRVDRRTGDERFIYHGNDGTTMPWNDTAQLDYLNPEVRRAVSDTILDVARRFPVIRFDAAMTLARKHYQRLWYPQPGSAGAIPSRAEHALPAAEFAARMPQEFWREVVDRVAEEAPETLLLAEAFWLMESFFVRSLGMHRVYNSAFMNLLRDQENAKHRGLIRETLAFDPEILKRYVNFLSNPDERTAIDQFGSHDRYFGACTLMATLPGLPMFGHGQIEGFTEKYGMEYRQARLEESPDAALVARHEAEIFPLLRRRRWFAGVENFHLLELATDGGRVNEDVIAYVNGAGGELTIVLFNNRYATNRGRLARTVGRSVADGETRRPEPKARLGELLGLDPAEGRYCRFRDLVEGLEYLQPSARIARSGLEVELGAFKYRVLADFEQVADDAQETCRQLWESNGVRGVPSLAAARSGLEIAPLRSALGELLESLAGDAEIAPSDRRPGSADGDARPELLKVTAVWRRLPLDPPPDDWTDRVAERVAAVDGLADLARKRGLRGRRRRAAADLADWLGAEGGAGGLRAAAALAETREVLPADLRTPILRGLVSNGLGAAGIGGRRARRIETVVQAALEEGWALAAPAPTRAEATALLERWSGVEPWRQVIGYHVHDGDGWVRQELFDELLRWRAAFAAWSWRVAPDVEAKAASNAIFGWLESLDRLREFVEESGYRVIREPDPSDDEVAKAKT